MGLRRLHAFLIPIPLAAALVLGGAACRKKAAHTPETGPMSHASEPAWFEDVTDRAGLDFHHDPGPVGDYLMPQSIGSGGAFFDFDNDGRLDIYLIHGAPPAVGSRNRLYHQQPDGHFRDVSEGSGLDVAGRGMGAAVGDVNNDGLPDMLLTEYGRLRLFVNQGQGRFRDVTDAAGLSYSRWATAASFFDYDRDGWLDLAVGGYVDYTPSSSCYDTRGSLEFCGPQGKPGVATRLFRNRGAGPTGDARFEDVSVASGLARQAGATLGLLCADLNEDHWPDMLLAEDGMANRLYINQRDGRFTEEAVPRGIAYNAFGAATADMGVAFGDVDGDGWRDIFMTHVAWEQHALWKQGPAGWFQDQTTAAGLGSLARRGTGFGTVLADFDQDGDLDLAWTNGDIRRGRNEGPFEPDMDLFWQPYAQRDQLLANDGTGRFNDISEANPAFCGRAAVGRGLACGDMDNDGALDLLVVNTGAPARLLRNAVPDRGHWLMIRAVLPEQGGRDAYGAEIRVQAGGRVWKRLVQPGSSYLVSNDPRAHFGLGPWNRFETITVVWPDGREESFPGGACDRLVVLRQGEGRRS